MRSARVLKVVVVSPGDVGEERAFVGSVAEEMNLGIAGELGLRIETWMWETDTYPAFHASGAQGLIDDLMRIDDADVVVGIFWNRFGTPVADAQSGTEHELRLAISAWKSNGRPEIMLHFNTLEHFFKSSAEHEQAIRVTKFREEMESQGLCSRYHGAGDFERKFRVQLTTWLRTHSHRLASGSETQPSGSFEPPVFPDAVARTRHLQHLSVQMGTKPVVTVEGLSGVGKTYLAAAFCAEAVRDHRYSFVWWHHPELKETVDSLLSQLEQPGDAGTASQCRGLVRRLVSGRGLLVVDDFERVDAASYAQLIDAARVISPPARVLLLSKTFPDPALAIEEGCVQLDGFDQNELLAFLAGRGMKLGKEPLQRLRSQTDGLPIAASMFATLATRFNYPGEALLAGTMPWRDRLRSWFEKICALIAGDSLLLLRNISVSETPFNRGAIQHVGRDLRLADTNGAFDQLQSTYLVQIYTPYRWRVHPLVATFAVESLPPGQREQAHQTLGTYYASGFPARPGEPLSDLGLDHKTLAVRHFQRAGLLKRSERLIAELVKTAKGRGAYELLIQLLKPQLESSDRDRWMDYHYAHCRLIMGRIDEAAAVVRGAGSPSQAPELLLSLARLDAEIIRAMGSPARALVILDEALAAARHGTLRGAVESQALSLRALLLLDTGRVEEGDAVCQSLLAGANARKDKLGCAVALTLLGHVGVANGKPEQAQARFADGAALFRQCGDRRGVAWASIELALVRAGQQREDARSALQEALSIRAEISDASPEYLDRLDRARVLPLFQPLLRQITGEIARVKKTLRMPAP